MPASPAELVPALIADAGDDATWRYIDFFTANIRNPNTRRAYTRACATFFAWCGEPGRSLATVQPFDVATYVEARQQTHSAPDVKQQLAAVRMLYDWLVTGQDGKRKEIAESVIAGRKSGAEMARLYNISPPTVSRIVAQHRTGPA